MVLVNVNIREASEAEDLVAYVEDFGRGLVVVGGDRSFGVGDYHQTPLESVLPVSSDPDDLLRRQPVAEVLSARHLRIDGFLPLRRQQRNASPEGLPRRPSPRPAPRRRSAR